MNNSLVLKDTHNTDKGAFPHFRLVNKNEPKNQTKKLDYKLGKHFDIKTKVIHLEVDKKEKVEVEVGLTTDQLRSRKLKRQVKSQKQTFDVYNFDEEEKKSFIPVPKVKVQVAKTQKLNNPNSSIETFVFYKIDKFVGDDPINKCYLALYGKNWIDKKFIDEFCVTTYENLIKQKQTPFRVPLNEKIARALSDLTVPDFNASEIRYNVSRIMRKRLHIGKIQYLVDWELVWLPYNIVQHFYRRELIEYQRGQIVSAQAKRQRDTYEDSEFGSLSPRDRLIMKRESAIVLEQAAKKLQARDNHIKKMRK